MRIVLLGTGTPNPDPDRCGPSTAILVNKSVYIIDFGPGIVRRATAAGIQPSQMSCAFLTHLHSDHTTGYPDLIFTPAVIGRKEPLEVFGPKGLSTMTNHIISAYKDDLEEREHWSILANKRGYIVNTHEISEGIIYEDANITVEAFLVNHSSLEAYGFKFIAEGRAIVISGDTCPSPKLIAKAKGCDALIHEVYTAVGLKKRSEEWQKYHLAVHTSTHELADIATTVKPDLLILYHQLHWARTDDELLSEVTDRYDGRVVSGKDLDAFEI
jgi:ribonuclease BN (tRNA processing enzyme)